MDYASRLHVVSAVGVQQKGEYTMPGKICSNSAESYANRPKLVNAICMRGAKRGSGVTKKPEERASAGARLRAARLEAHPNMSATEFALMAGIPKPTYDNLENGSRGISPTRAAQLAPLVGKTPEYILYGKVARGISFFLAIDLVSFKTLRDGGIPVSEKTIIMQGGAQLPDRLIFVEVPDDAMMREKYPAYPRRAIAMVDPDIHRRLEDYVAGEVVQAVCGAKDEAVFRELYRVGGKIVLRAYNSTFPDITFRPDRGDYIVGLVVGSFSMPVYPVAGEMQIA